MKPFISALYILFGLLMITLTYFENFRGPNYLTNIGWILVVFGIFYPYYGRVVNYFKVEFEDEKNSI
ncbi:hypothetical protein [Bacillus sp. AFS017336]|uniref:hypothetical protein n=1 Tax=Bacillus sp. AFS017336 TaxID=2033489 RepID=UPI000BF0E788|nr:hypothetical protein [Bacillus sp. AFS017336]PEL07700.1 hypothetical protein CN601_19860 [Bacillus sp. AFS017336]